MSESSESEGSQEIRPVSEEERLEEIREILLGGERRRISGLQRRLDDSKERVEEISQALPQAVLLAQARDSTLNRVLAPSVEVALKESARRNPEVLAEAVFPILGPAIRKTISETFSKLVESINHTLEYSLSIRGLKWRWEALRTGRSFAEVVLFHTLLYRVEQVFLIHRGSGLLLQHAWLPEVKGRDPDMVSGMLTALQDFARDSFDVAREEGLKKVQVGELDVWVESGPLAVLAAVIRGHPPMDLRFFLQSTLEKIHLEQGEALGAFEGDTTLFQVVHPRLEACLLVKFGTQFERKKSGLGAWLVLGVVGLAVVMGCVALGRDWWLWKRWEERLKREEGYVVTDSWWRWGKYGVEGLKDPLARDVTEVAREWGVKPERLRGQWRPFFSLDDSFVLQRARHFLKVPEGIDLVLKGRMLGLTGDTSEEWFRWAQDRVMMIPGIEGLETPPEFEVEEEKPSRSGDEALISEWRRAIEGISLRFLEDTVMDPTEEPEFRHLVDAIRQLRLLVHLDSKYLRLKILGYAEEAEVVLGNENSQASGHVGWRRAEWVRNRLIAEGIAPDRLSVEGRVLPRSEGNSPSLRQVVFRMDWDDQDGRQ